MEGRRAVLRNERWVGEEKAGGVCVLRGRCEVNAVTGAIRTQETAWWTKGKEGPTL